MEQQKTMSEPPDVKAGGCTFFVALLSLLVGYAVLYPASPPKNGFLLNAAERTYLEAEVEEHGVMDRPYSTMTIYYTQLGGWFSWTKRVGVASLPVSTPTIPGQVVETSPITYERRSKSGDSQTRIYVSCPACVGTIITLPERFPKH